MACIEFSVNRCQLDDCEIAAATMIPCEWPARPRKMEGKSAASSPQDANIDFTEINCKSPIRGKLTGAERR